MRGHGRQAVKWFTYVRTLPKVLSQRPCLSPPRPIPPLVQPHSSSTVSADRGSQGTGGVPKAAAAAGRAGPRPRPQRCAPPPPRRRRPPAGGRRGPPSSAPTPGASSGRRGGSSGAGGGGGGEGKALREGPMVHGGRLGGGCAGQERATACAMAWEGGRARRPARDWALGWAPASAVAATLAAAARRAAAGGGDGSCRQRRPLGTPPPAARRRSCGPARRQC